MKGRPKYWKKGVDERSKKKPWNRSRNHSGTQWRSVIRSFRGDPTGRDNCWWQSHSIGLLTKRDTKEGARSIGAIRILILSRSNPHHRPAVSKRTKKALWYHQQQKKRTRINSRNMQVSRSTFRRVILCTLFWRFACIPMHFTGLKSFPRSLEDYHQMRRSFYGLVNILKNYPNWYGSN